MAIRRFVPTDTGASASSSNGSPSPDIDIASTTGFAASNLPTATLVVTGQVQYDLDASGGGTASGQAKIEYSTNGGGAWTPVHGDLNISDAIASPNTSSDDSGSITRSVALTNVDLSQLQLRAYADTTRTSTATATADADLTDWYVEIPFAGLILEV